MKLSRLSWVYLAIASLWGQNLWAACHANIVLTKPDSIYIDNLDGTVSDIETGLTWQKCSMGQTWNAGADANSGSDDSCDGSATTHNWQAALTTANNDSSYGHSDWRLPNKNELKSLVDSACVSPSINATLFPATVQNDWYWSASPHASNTSSAWLVNYNIGYDSTTSKNVTYYVRLVRGSQSL